MKTTLLLKLISALALLFNRYKRRPPVPKKIMKVLTFLSICRILLTRHVTQNNTHTLPGICNPPDAGEQLLVWGKSLLHKEVLNEEDAEQEESSYLASSPANSRSQDIRGDHRRHTEEHRGCSQQVEG